MPTDISRLGVQIVSGLGFIGAGFYEGAILAACMVLITEVSFGRVGKRIRHSPEFTLALHFREKNALDKALRHCKDRKYFITDLQIVGGGMDYVARVELRQSGDLEEETLLREIRDYPDILDAKIVRETSV